MEEKTVLITGANGGLGKETIKALLTEGVNKIILAGRSKGKLEEVKNELVNDFGNHLRDTLTTVDGFDMTNPESIEEAVGKIEIKIDVLFLQAGGVIFSDDYQYIEHDGVRTERTVFQNTLGGYMTLVSLIGQGKLDDYARVVFAGGEGARGIPGLIEKPEVESAAGLKGYLNGSNAPKYNPMNAIGYSKLMSALLVAKLSTLDSKREYLWFTPGLTYGTNGLAEQPPLKRWFLEKVVFGIMALLGKAQSPARGGEKYSDALLGKIGNSGDVIGAPEGTTLGTLTDQKPMHSAFTDQALIDAFWNHAREVYVFQLQKELELA